MGALHEGHLSLIRAAGERCTAVAVTIFVNPRSISKMRGLNNSNIKGLKRQFHLKLIEVVPDSSLGAEEMMIG